MIYAVEWKENYLELLDQTKLPTQTVFLRLHTIEEVYEAIQKLRVRGAPAIGITAAYGLYLGLRELSLASPETFFQKLDEKIDYLSSARPTAVNLFWALKNIKDQLQKTADISVEDLKLQLLEIAKEIQEDDGQRCEDIGKHGLAVVPSGATILTHCNTGALATGGIGTAFGVIFNAHRNGNNVAVFATETRPVLQGARLTVWELMTAHIPVHLICDSAAASLVQQKKVDMVILGADRIAADGSVANKIGTYNLAVVANHHKIPFYVAAPLSTFDVSVKRGSDIPIEMRDADEIRRIFGECLITVPEAPAWNPAFDITPPELISGIITERGIIYPPFSDKIQKLLTT